jgi:hypothetical protein
MSDSSNFRYFTENKRKIKLLKPKEAFGISAV